MKQHIFFLLFLLTQIASFAQDCPFFQTYMDKGNAELKKGAKANFTLAIDAFSTAMTHCPAKAAEARKGIDAAFAAINELKIQADKNAKEAKEAAKKAKESAELAQKREVEAQAAKNELNNKLETIKAANARLVKPLVKLFDDFVYSADYDAAQDMLFTAVSIDKELSKAGEKAFSFAFLELIFYHTECGKQNLLPLHKKHLRIATQLSKAFWLYLGSENRSYTQGDTLQYLQNLLAEQLVAEQRTMIQKRYYPTMIKVEGDTFEMERHKMYYEDTTKYYVSLSNYEISQTEVTVQQYLLFCEASGYRRPDAPSWGWRGDNPAVNVSWGDAAAYNNWLTRQQNLLNARKDSLVYSLDGKAEWAWKDVGDCDSCAKKDAEISLLHRPTVKGYRLPTEAEWQFAAAGGKKGINNHYEYAGGNDIEAVAWYTKNTTTHTEVVATKKKNDLDLYDMSGNVFEWCQDWRNPYPENTSAAAPVSDPYSDISDDYRVLRGGSWFYDAAGCRVVYRLSYSFPYRRSDSGGFRPARTL